MRGRRLSARGRPHRLVGRDRRRAGRPRGGASRLLPSRDARVPAPFELRTRGSMDWTICSATGEQVMFDLAFDREQRREKHGYVTPAQARAFLQMSRQLRLGRDADAAARSRRPRLFPGHRVDRRRRRETRIEPPAGGLSARRLRRRTPQRPSPPSSTCSSRRVSSRRSRGRCSTDRRVRRRVSRASRRTAVRARPR